MKQKKYTRNISIKISEETDKKIKELRAKGLNISFYVREKINEMVDVLHKISFKNN